MINRNSGKAITVKNSSMADGAPISQQTLGSGQQQQWSIEERSCTTAPLNQPPVAVATTTSLTGASPLSVTFTGSSSYDPDGDPITYEWDFGDGSTYATQANPVHVFTAKAGSQGVGLVLNYTVKLTVIDNKGLRSPVQTFYVRLNNSNPTVRITNPVNNGKYALDKSTSYTLGATVTGNSIKSQIWQVKLRHNNHEQLITTASGANPVVTISPVGCDGDDYYYVIAVNVTDFNNLSGQDSVRIYPDCNSPKLNVTGLTATTVNSSSVQLNWTNPTLPFDKVLVVGRAGSALTDIPLEPAYTANPSFTGNGSDLPGGGKVLYQGTGSSVAVTDLTAGQLYYFRVYAHAGNGWSGGVEVSATPSAVTANRPPVAVATTTSLTGSAPLSVTFTGSNSYDPDGDPLTYEWQFYSSDEDRQYVQGANQVRSFSPKPGKSGVGVITRFYALLTVTDSKGLRSTSQLFTIQLNDTAPTAKITNPVNNAKYALDKSTSYTLAANITNAGSNNSILWQVKLRRGTSEQLITTRSDVNPVVDIAPVGCDGVDTYYLITLKVTGIGGTASAQDSVKIYPDCNPSPPGSVTAVDPGKCYRLVSRLSGKVLGVGGSAQNDGDPLIQQTDASQLTQGWRFTPADGGYYSISVLATRKGIQVSNYSTADDASLEQWTYWGGSHQQWTAQRNAEGYFTFSNRNSGKAITVRNASTAEGAQISQMTLGSGQQQQWSVQERACPAGGRLGAAETGVAFRLWPNPARDHVLIDLSPAIGQPVDLQLNDLAGRQLQQTKLDAAPAEPYRFDTGQLPNGFYLIQIRPTGQSPTMLRLFIQR